MKYLSIVQFIMGLKERDRVIAMMIIAIAALFTLNEFHTNRMLMMSGQYEKELMKMSVACDSQKNKIMQDDIAAIQKARQLVDSLAIINLTVIRNNNNNIEKKHRR